MGLFLFVFSKLCLDVNVQRYAEPSVLFLFVFYRAPLLLFKDTALQRHGWLTSPSPQGKLIVGVAYDCLEKMVYWTEISPSSINKANVEGGDIIPVIESGGVHAIAVHSV